MSWKRCSGPDCQRRVARNGLCAAHDAQRERGWPLAILPARMTPEAREARARRRRKASKRRHVFDFHTGLYITGKAVRRALRQKGISYISAERAIAAGVGLADLWGCEDIVEVARAARRRRVERARCPGPGCCRVATRGDLCRAHYEQRRRGTPLHPLRAHAATFERRAAVIVAFGAIGARERDELARCGTSAWSAAKRVVEGGTVEGVLGHPVPPATAPCAAPGCPRPARPGRRRGLCLRCWRGALRAGLPGGAPRRGPVEREIIRR